MSENYLVIPDVHVPFEHPRALQFCKEVKKDFGVKDEHVYSLGDFDDQFWASSHLKSPDAGHTARQEIAAARLRIKLWAEVFPQMKICESNHTDRFKKRVMEAELPSVILRQTEEILGYPKGWQTKPEWVVFGSKDQFCLQHGDGYSGANGHINAAMDNGMNTIIGHLHSFGGVNYINTRHQSLWAANGGCLIDLGQYAFHYAKHARRKVTLGVILVADGGRFPLFIPLV